MPAMSNSKDWPEKKAKSPRQWSAAEKLRAVVQSSELSGEQLGEFLRSSGLHQAQLDEWRSAAQQGLDGTAKKKPKASPEAKRIKALEKDLLRKDRALAEVTALLALKKRMQELWGDGDDDSTT